MDMLARYNLRVKKVLLCDMDDVMVNCAMLVRINEHLGTAYQDQDETIPYYRQEIILDGTERNKFFTDIFPNMYYYKDVAIKENAREILQKLNEKYELYIVTDFCIPGHSYLGAKIIPDKFKILTSEFPFLQPEQFVFIRSKKLLTGDIMIDDKVSNLSPHVSQKLLFTAWHNKNISDAELFKQGITRVNNWSDIASKLL